MRLYTRQLELFLEESHIGKQLPEESRELVQDLLSRLLGEVVDAEFRGERCEGNE